MAEPALDPIVLNEAQVILAEKRTNLATLRTGLAVLALPVGVLSFLIAVSERFEVQKVYGYLTILGLVCLALAVLGGFLIFRAVVRLIRDDRLLRELKKDNLFLERLTDTNHRRRRRKV